MPFVSLKLNPGIDVEKTPLLNETGWSNMKAARFFEGMAQKIGGWAGLNNSNPLLGICTGLHAWADLSGAPYIAAGSEQALQIFYGGTIGNITPVRVEVDATPLFNTTIGSPNVTIHRVAHGESVGDWVNIVIPVAVGGLIVWGYYPITVVPNADHYVIVASANATANVVDGGAVPVFDTTMASANVQVTLAKHGLVAGDQFIVQVSTVVGGITIAVGSYPVVAPVTTNTFTIVPAGLAGSTATVSENGGNARIDYLLHTGAASATYAANSGVFGGGLFGGGLYGGTTGGSTVIPVRQWFLNNFGQDLVANRTGSPLFLWTPPPAINNSAIAIDTTNFPSATAPPQQVNMSIVSDPQQMIICFGVDDAIGHVYDPLLIRWCDIGNFEDWVATSVNQAGSFRIPTGSELIAGIRAPNFIVCWTDIDMWLMSYLGGTGEAELVWGFNKVASGVNLLCARGAAVYRNIVFWVASNGFFAYDGNTVQQIPCPVWDKFWYQLNRTQSDKVNAQVNSYFQEVSWAFESSDGPDKVDARITYNIRENSWTYDDNPTLTARSAWTDTNVYGSPIGTDKNGILQQHEVGSDANGAVLQSFVESGWFSISEGTYYTMIERLSADFIATGGDQSVFITVRTQNYPDGPVSVYGPFSYVAGTGPPYSIVRARGRFARIRVGSTSLGVFWRLGNLRYMAQQAGRR